MDKKEFKLVKAGDYIIRLKPITGLKVGEKYLVHEASNPYVRVCANGRPYAGHYRLKYFDRAISKPKLRLNI